MCSAQKIIYFTKRIATPLFGVAILFVFSASSIAASDSKICKVGSDCTLGEFIFDDNYQIETGAVCNLNTKYPNGTDHLVNQSLTSTSDAWYGYTFTAPSTK